MAPSSRIILTLLCVTAMGLALCAALVYGSLDRLSLRTAEANVDFLLSQLRETIETNVGLGLPLSDIRLAQDLIERSRATDHQVLAVEIFSPQGISLFNTDRGSIGEPISTAWQETIGYRMINDRWRVEELGHIVVGQPIRNDFGEVVGHVAVTISGEPRSLHAQAVLAGLAGQTAFIVPVVLILAWLAATAVFKHVNRDFKLLTEQLASSGSSTSPSAILPNSTSQAPAVLLSVEQAVGAFDRATAEVLKMDDDEDRAVA